MSTARPQQQAPPASRYDRAGAISPAESMSSVGTSATVGGTKRKERDYEADGAAGEETNINVVVRCRGRSEREVRENSAVVVTTEGVKGKVIELSMGPSALSNKTYSFDRVFSPAADQSMIFDDVVKPILDEVCCDAAALGGVSQPTDLARCSRVSTAPYSPTAKPARARRIPCRET